MSVRKSKKEDLISQQPPFLWSWLAREGYVEKNLLAGFPLPKVPQYIIKTLNDEHIKNLFSAIDRSTASGARYYCTLMLLLNAGMRISELVNIKVNDIDIQHGFVTIFGKGQKQRILILKVRILLL